VEFLVGGDDLLAKVEEALAGHETGDELNCSSSPNTPSATTSPNWCASRPRGSSPNSSSPACLRRPARRRRTPGHAADAIYVVTEVYPSHVVLDGNHPLAGMALRLRMKVSDVREATDDEIEARSVGSARPSRAAAPPVPAALH
jgi:FKBP-type peptidyl-prolyl cis-trans isomerase SlyD